jgi:hypothetical protein
MFYCVCGYKASTIHLIWLHIDVANYGTETEPHALYITSDQAK